MSDRVISSGISIPQWMKGKPDSGFDPSTLSPPTYDDDFFQIKLNKPAIVEPPQGGYRMLGEGDSNAHATKRPLGLNDSFHGVKNECGTSVVAVAHRMLHLQPPSQRQRRNSKSLPASPLGSPETRRRIVNRFFTTVSNTDEEGKEKGGSTSSILEALNRERNMRSQSTAPPSEARMELLPQPSEYREMNFWSPTSM